MKFKKAVGNIMARPFEALAFEPDGKGRYHLTAAEYRLLIHTANSWHAAQQLLKRVKERTEARERGLR